MKTMEWSTTDKTTWGRGAWQDEPDKRQWVDEATGLPCLIVRNPSGALCGYVGVPVGHPAHGKDYNDVNVEAHGGLTFAHGCTELTPEMYERQKTRLESSTDEARCYPVGDAARFIREWGPSLASYETWREKAEGHFICHLPEPGEPDNVWWLGFDCAHSGDLCPSYANEARRVFRSGYDTYKDIGYVTREVTNLAKQLAEQAPA